jgi:hypothetical protein
MGRNHDVDIYYEVIILNVFFSGGGRYEYVDWITLAQNTL